MTQRIKLTFLLMIVFTSGLLAQESLYDCNNAKKFAGYLFNTGQYELTRHELERIRFFCDFDSVSELYLLKSYRKLGLLENEQDYFLKQGVDKTQSLSPDFRDEYIRLLMAQQKYTEVKSLIEQGFNFRQIPEHQIGIELLMKNWEKAYQLSQSENARINFKLTGLAGVAEKSHLAKRKNPALAAILSAVIPGAGKAYCGYWGDAAISFLFTASTTFFTVRGFDKYGTKSVYPWIIGGLAASYYTSNIYGGAKSANRYNNNLDHSFIHETEKILYSDY